MSLFIKEIVINYCKNDMGEKMKIERKIKQEKNTIESEKKKRYATFLKRKRLEKKFTLEEVSTGICTVSYLSRIENNLVDVDESYFISLFKKFNIDFNSLKEEKENEIFNELIKCYLSDDDEKAISIITNALQTNYYVDLEYDLMILYDNIMKELYSEALKQILELNKKIDLLLETELIFYLFLSALYAYKTYQLAFAFKQIIVLCEMNIVYQTYRYAIFDLALDIFHHMECHEQFFKYYNLIHTDSYLSFYPESALKHQAQLIYIESITDNSNVNLILNEIKAKVNDKNKEEIEWIILKNMVKNGANVEALVYLSDLNPTPRLIALESILVLGTSEESFVKSLMQRRKQVNFRITDQCFELMYDVCISIKCNNDYLTAYDLMKKILIVQNKTTRFSFFLNIQINIFIEIALKCGRYKDGLKIIQLIFKEKKLI